MIPFWRRGGFSFLAGVCGCWFVCIWQDQQLTPPATGKTDRSAVESSSAKILVGESSSPVPNGLAVQPSTQELSPSPPQQPGVDDWTERLALLERRVNAMEQILVTTAQITALDAERRLKDAKAHLANSRQLFMRGQLAEIEFQNDRFEVDRLSQELELARGTSAQHQAMSQIEIANAAQQLFAAQQRLEETETLVRRGYASATQIDRDREYVSLAERRLELAKQRLEAAKQLDAIGK